MSTLEPAPDQDSPMTWAISKTYLRLAVWTILLGEAVYLAVLLTYTPEQWFRASGPLLMTIVALTGAYLMSRGRASAALNVLAYGSCAVIAAVALINGGIRVPLLYASPLVILMAGWMISARAAITTAALISVIILALMLAEVNGMLRQTPSASPMLFAVAQVVVNGLSAALVMVLTKAYKAQLTELNAVSDKFARRTQELEVARSELQQAQAVAKVGSWIYNLETGSIRMSDEACRIMKVPEGSVGSLEAYLMRTLSEDRASLEQAWRDALKHGTLDHEHRVKVGGSMQWLRLRADLATTDGQALKQAVGTVQDVTVRKTADLELRQSERRFSTAFRSSPVAASIATLEDGIVLDANHNYERDFGWTHGDMIGRSTAEFGLWPEPAMRKEWARALRSFGRVVNYETQWMHKSGKRRDVSISGEIIALDGVNCVLAYTTDITERKQAEEQIQSLAFYDPLTHLPNRRLLTDRLEQAIAAGSRHQRYAALLFIDLDNFKSLNDTHGHERGDLLLRQVAHRLVSQVREGDTVARLGGDEFVVMLEDLSENAIEAATKAEGVSEKILDALNQRYQLGHDAFHSTPSIGVTLFGAQAESIEEPLKRADLAMYQAKAAGRNTVRFFDPQMQAAINTRMQLERGLRDALVQGQFTLVYQPQVRGVGNVMGAEALVRWLHPQEGMVSPAQFIPLAEETGLILPLGSWVLETACMQLSRWASMSGFEQLSISVNVSARQFQQPDFVEQVQAVLSRTGARPQRLKLELTESMTAVNVESLIDKMIQLQQQGVGFSLDDFGTGYSSLSYLKRLPIDQLKIDQSFVRDILMDPNDAAISRMVIVLADSLGLQVIAEGVETQAQKEALAAQGCHAYQGYLFSRPLPLAEFEAYVGRTLPASA